MGVTLTMLWQEYRAAHPDGYIRLLNRGLSGQKIPNNSSRDVPPNEPGEVKRRWPSVTQCFLHQQ